ncbi:MAG: hypothetical protein HPY76_06875 [Anaerolineae bacterium]|nr:hypothetical protein [Anaerolineae bacterium]
MKTLIGLDLGTSRIKAVAYDPAKGKVLRTASRATPTEHPTPERSEHDPEAIWQTAADCLREASLGLRVAGLAISSMAEAGLPLDAADQPLAKVIAWHDRRTLPQAVWWEHNISEAKLHAITGQRVNPSFGINKLIWWRTHAPEMMERMRWWLSLPDYILLRLTGVRATERSLASRTLLFDQMLLNWSDTMLALAELRREMLPPVAAGGAVIGALTAEAATRTGIPAGTPCALGGHDHLCATLAAGVAVPGSAADSSGSAQSLYLLLPDFISNPEVAAEAFACYASPLDGYYAFKGGARAVGSALDWWLRHLTGLPADAEVPYASLAAEAQSGVGTTYGPLWLPHFLGAGSPENDVESRGALVGVRLEHQRGDMVRALLEGLACSTRRNLEEMLRLTGQKADRLVLVGGVHQMHLFNQVKADLLNMPLVVNQVPEAAAVGAALLAGVGAGVFGSARQAAESLRYPPRVVEPDPTRVAWYEGLYQEMYKPLYPHLRAIHRAMSRQPNTVQVEAVQNEVSYA